MVKVRELSWLVFFLVVGGAASDQKACATTVLLLYAAENQPVWFSHLTSLYAHDDDICFAYSRDPAHFHAFNLTMPEDGRHVNHAEAPTGSYHLPAMFLCSEGACARPQDAIADVVAWKSQALSPTQIKGFQVWIDALLPHRRDLFAYANICSERARCHPAGTNAKTVPMPPLRHISIKDDEL